MPSRVSCGHRITGNDVFETVRETGDHGPFNSWGRDRHWIGSGANGPHVKERAKLDSHLPTIIEHNRFSHWGSHSWGIDLDDGSSNYLLTSNLCLGCSFKLREGYYRAVENNICISAYPPGKHCCYDQNEDVVRCNIIVAFKSGVAQHMIYARPSQCREVDYNLYFNTVGVPAVFEMEGPHEKLPPKMTLEEWRDATGFDRHSVQADPLFVDPAHDDYRVSASSPALELGFRNFPTTDFGTRAPALKAQAAALRQSHDRAHVEIIKLLENVGKPGPIPPPQAEIDKSVFWRGATLKPLRGMALLSATGLSKEEGALVDSVAPGSPAAEAGLRRGDVVLQADGRKVATVDDMNAGGGQTVKLGLWRGQNPVTASVP